MINWYVLFLQKFFLFCGADSGPQLQELAEFWSPVLSALFGLMLIVGISVFSGFYRIQPENMSDEELLPPRRFGLVAFLEMLWSIVASTLESVLGETDWIRFVPLLGSLFFIITFCNLSGIFPGLEPCTTSMSFSGAMAIIVFIAFNFIGLKEAGFKYIKHLAGPVLWMAPLLFVIELSSLLSRPVSLSLRVFGNVSGDHIVFQIFSGLMGQMHVPFLPIPAVFLAFGAFMAGLQAFIFMTLSAVYLRMAIDSKHNHH